LLAVVRSVAEQLPPASLLRGAALRGKE
jgi:hypothetical protein